MKNVFLLSACLSVITMNHVMAMDVLDADSPSVIADAAEPLIVQHPTPLTPLLTDPKHQDLLIVMLGQLDLESAVNTLKTHKMVYTNNGLWRSLSIYHSIPVREGQVVQEAVFAKIHCILFTQRMITVLEFTPAIMKGFFKEVIANPYLWPAFIGMTPQKFYPDLTTEAAQDLINTSASLSTGLFEGISAADGLAYLEHIAARGSVGAESAQGMLEFLNFPDMDD